MKNIPAFYELSRIKCTLLRFLNIFTYTIGLDLLKNKS